ncbi:MAG: PAS domain S-box protein [Syntrophaceae bacterium]|nr:PAS domain S-box protein [Syntrophaceae bacterium]
MSDEPLYNSRITKGYIEYLKAHNPDVDIESVLDSAGITAGQIEDRGHWFTQEQVDRFQETLLDILQDHDLPRKVGRYTALSAAAGDVQRLALGFMTPARSYRMLGRIFSQASKSFTVSTRDLDKNRVEVIARPNKGIREKPYQCANRMGTLEAIGQLFTGEYASIDHTSCIHRGDPVCRYIVSWKRPPAIFWKQVRNWAILIGFIIVAALIPATEPPGWLNLSLTFAAAVSILSLLVKHLENRELRNRLQKQGETAGDLMDRINMTYKSLLLVQKIGEGTSQTLQTNQFLRTIMESMEGLLDFDRGLILLADDNKTKLVFADGYGYTPEEQQFFFMGQSFFTNSPSSRGPFVVCFREQKPLLVNDIDSIRKDLSPKSMEYAREMGVQSFICVPIAYEGEVEGILAVDNKRTKRNLTQSDLNLLLGIAPSIAFSVRLSRVYQSLKESEERFRNLSENSPDIIFTLDSDGRINYVNPAWEKILGHRAEEVLGRFFLDFVSDADHRLYIEQFKRIRDGLYIMRDATGKILDRSGRGRLFIANVAPDFNSEGNVKGIVGSLKDITEQRRLEEQLNHASKMEAIGTLTGGIAHDFNNIIHAMSGYNQILMRNHGISGDWKHLESIHELTERAADLIRQLLFFSRRVESRPERIDLNGEIHSLCELLYRTIPKMIAVEFVPSERPCTVHADPVQISQVIMNLIVNARDAMPEGGTIKIRTDVVRLEDPHEADMKFLKPGMYVWMSIQDSGFGMDQTTLDHIFEPFFTTKEAGKGTGLGLSVVYGIVKHHEGSILCSSEPGKGSTFQVYLPYCTEAAEYKQREESGTSVIAGTGTTLLFVDDDQNLREIGQDMLQYYGYDVLTADSGEKALDIFRDHSDRIGLVVLDLIMPGMGGAKCMIELLNLKPDAKIVISSGCLPDAALASTIEKGAAGYVEKPYSFDRLNREIERILHPHETVSS